VRALGLKLHAEPEHVYDFLSSVVKPMHDGYHSRVIEIDDPNHAVSGDR